MPNRVITDLGSPFTVIEFKSWAQNCGISIDYASIAHMQANGQVETANDLILAKLKLRLDEDLKDYDSKWIDKLPETLGTTHPSSRATRYSHFFLVYGSEAVLSANLIWTSPRIEQYDEGEAKHTKGLS
jgi:hypothetical protein